MSSGAGGLGAILAGLSAEDRAQRERAAARLLALLQQLARTIPFHLAGASPTADDLDEIVASIAFKLVDRGIRKELLADDDGCARYLRAMLLNRWRDLCRAANHLTGLDAAGLESLAAPPAEEGAGLDPAAIARALLDRAFEHLLATRHPRYHDGFRRSWNELLRLTFGGEPLDAIIGPRLPANATEADRVRERDRLFQNHKRLRDYLARAIDDLAARGGFDPEHAEQARAALFFLLRCQRRTPAFVRVNR